MSWRSLKRISSTAIFLLLLLVAARSQQEQRVTQLATGVYFWQGDTLIRRPANCAWVIFRDYVLVIDANFPWGAREILPEIRRTTDKPIRFVFDTHYHGDHSFGNLIYTRDGAVAVASEKSLQEFITKGQKGFKDAQNDPKTAAEPDRRADQGPDRVAVGPGPDYEPLLELIIDPMTAMITQRISRARITVPMMPMIQPAVARPYPPRVPPLAWIRFRELLPMKKATGPTRAQQRMLRIPRIRASVAWLSFGGAAAYPPIWPGGGGGMPMPPGGP